MNEEMHVNIILPTRNRWELLNTTLEALKKSTYQDLSIHLVLDSDYGGIPEWTAVLLSEWEISLYVDDGNNNLVKQIGNAMSQIKTGMILGIGDDSIFHPNCIKLSVEAMQQRFHDGMGVVGLNQYIDGRPMGSKGVYSLLNRKFLDHFPDGNPFCPDFYHFYPDTELVRFAESIGAFYYCESARIDHIRLNDETTNRHLIYWDIDTETHRERMRRGYLWGKNFDLIRK